MAFIVDEETGNITLVQGDSGEYTVEDVPCDKNYKLYFGIYDSKRKPVGFEINEIINRGGGDTHYFDNDLYCWSYSSNNLYTLSLTVNVGDTLYNSDNEATLNTITSIKSIVYHDDTYSRDSEDDLKEYRTDLYAWGDSSLLYTENLDVKVDDVLLDNDGEQTEYSITSINSIISNEEEYTRDSESDTGLYTTDFYAYEGYTDSKTYVYFQDAAPTAGDNVFNSSGTQVDTINEIKTLYKFNYIAGDNSDVQTIYTDVFDEIQAGTYIYDEYGNRISNQYGYYVAYGVIGRLDRFTVKAPKEGGYDIILYEYNGTTHSCIKLTTSTTTGYIRNLSAEAEDIKTLENTLYAWSNSETSIYTLSENPEIDDTVYDADGEAQSEVNSIVSFKVSTDVYDRNQSEDVKTLIQTSGYAWSSVNNIIYTLSESATVGYSVYNDNLEPIGSISSVASFLVSSNEYLRNSANDIVPPSEGDDIPTTNVTFKIPPSLTNYLTVKKNEEYAEYYFGIKLCSEANDYEDTLLLGDGELGDLNTITVYPKKLEGTING